MEVINNLEIHESLRELVDKRRYGNKLLIRNEKEFQMLEEVISIGGLAFRERCDKLIEEFSKVDCSDERYWGGSDPRNNYPYYVQYCGFDKKYTISTSHSKIYLPKNSTIEGFQSKSDEYYERIIKGLDDGITG